MIAVTVVASRRGFVIFLQYKGAVNRTAVFIVLVSRNGSAFIRISFHIISISMAFGARTRHVLMIHRTSRIFGGKNAMGMVAICADRDFVILLCEKKLAMD